MLIIERSFVNRRLIDIVYLNLNVISNCQMMRKKKEYFVVFLYKEKDFLYFVSGCEKNVCFQIKVLHNKNQLKY